MATQPEPPVDAAAEMKERVETVKQAGIDPDKVPAEMWEKMGLTKEEFLEVMARMKEREARTPAVGSIAADFELELLDASGARTGEMRKLSSHLGRPVALVFGSYT
jgi:hypothetical protein